MGLIGRSQRGGDAGRALPPLTSVALGPGDVPGYRMTIDRAHAAEKLPPGATDGLVRAWSGGVGRRYLVALTIDRFPHPSAARRHVRHERRSAKGVVGRFDVPGVAGAVGMTVTKVGAMPDDGSDGHGSHVIFSVGTLSVGLSHLGPAQQPTDLLVACAREQFRRLSAFG